MPYKPPHEPVSEKRRGAQKLVLTPDQVEEMGQRKLKGESYRNIAKAYGVQCSTATKHIHRWMEKHREEEAALKNQPLQAKPATPSQPIGRPIQSHDDRPTEDFDPLKTQLVYNPISSEDKKQSYREDLLWACHAAGQKLRTGNRPNSCPNDKAFFLYQLACENPKDFMTKFSQMETKEKDDADTRKSKKSTQFMLDEVESQLEALEM